MLKPSLLLIAIALSSTANAAGVTTEVGVGLSLSGDTIRGRNGDACMAPADFLPGAGEARAKVSLKAGGGVESVEWVKSPPTPALASAWQAHTKQCLFASTPAARTVFVDFWWGMGK